LTSYVLDTSAVMAFLRSEEGGGMVREIIEGQDRETGLVVFPFMTLMEVEYLSFRKGGFSGARQVVHAIQSWPVEFRESTPEWSWEAAKVKTRAQISVADAWNAALALMLDAELVHKDPEFDRVEGLRHLRLPYKGKKGAR
jgi:predicted nucleic acid-binding protein